MLYWGATHITVHCLPPRSTPLLLFFRFKNAVRAGNSSVVGRKGGRDDGRGGTWARKAAWIKNEPEIMSRSKGRHTFYCGSITCPGISWLANERLTIAKHRFASIFVFFKKNLRNILLACWERYIGWARTLFVSWLICKGNVVSDPAERATETNPPRTYWGFPFEGKESLPLCCGRSSSKVYRPWG